MIIQQNFKVLGMQTGFKDVLYEDNSNPYD